MGKCSKCGKKILYNKYVMYQGRVLCKPCDVARLLKETVDKEKAKTERKARKSYDMKELIKPSKKVKEVGRKLGLQLTGHAPKCKCALCNPKNNASEYQNQKEDPEDETGKTAENTR